MTLSGDEGTIVEGVDPNPSLPGMYVEFGMFAANLVYKLTILGTTVNVRITLAHNLLEYDKVSMLPHIAYRGQRTHLILANFTSEPSLQDIVHRLRHADCLHLFGSRRRQVHR